MSRYFRLRVSQKLFEDFEREIEKPGYGRRKQGRWVGEALERLEQEDPNLELVGVGDDLDFPRNQRLAVMLTKDAFEKLVGMSLKIRQSAPLVEDVQTLIVRTAIRRRVRHDATVPASDSSC